MENEEKQTSLIDSIWSTVKQFNCCLRPHYDSQQLTKILSQYKQISFYQDPYYGECYVVENKKENKVLMLSVGQKESFEKRMEVCKAHQRLSSKYVINTMIVDDVPHRGFMWSKHDIYLLHDYILIDLQKEFDHRVIIGEIFTEDEVKTIAKAIGNALLQVGNHSSVRMKHIYFCNRGQQIKLAPQTLFHYENNIQTIQHNKKEIGIFLAPQQLIALQKGECNITAGLQNNAYTLGVILLSLLTMNPLSEVYDYFQGNINQKKISELLSVVSMRCAYELHRIIEELLKKDISERLSIKKMVKRLGQEPQQNVKVTLLKQEETKQSKLTVKMERESVKNYLGALVHPRVTSVGEYLHVAEDEEGDGENVVARRRIRYMQDQRQVGYFVGDDPKGIYKYADGQTYQGDWKKGKMHGSGKLYFANQQLRYQGSFFEGLFHGQGVEYSAGTNSLREQEIEPRFVRLSVGSWIKYQGTFHNDFKQGAGKVYFHNGSWAGNFKRGQPNGDGVYTPSDGQSPTRGIWEDGLLISKYQS